MYSASDLRKGLKIEIDGAPWLITNFDFLKPGKGQTIYKCKMKNMITGTGSEKSYRSNDKIGKPNLEDRKMAYSYPDGDNLIFSDLQTYEEVMINSELLGKAIGFLEDDMECDVLLYNDLPVEVLLPNFVEKEVDHTEPGARGDTTSSNVLKPAWLANKHEIMVPLFVNTGDIVKIDTRTGAYVERVKK